MNYDLIIKLARLANENPNENEANLAARKVCKLIKAANYKFKSDTTVTSEQRANKTESEPKTWADVQRSADPEFKSKRYTNSNNPYSWVGFDFETKSNREWQPTQAQKDYWARTGSHFTESQRKSREFRTKQNLKCYKCNQIIETGFIGPPQMFKCNLCIWKEYQESKNG